MSVSLYLYNLSIYIYSKVNKKMKKEKIEEELFKGYSCFFEYIHKIISLEDIEFSFTELFKLYMLRKVINIFNEKFLLLIIMNVIMFYVPLEHYSDHFLYKAKMAVKQTIEGTIGLIICLIPKYEELKTENK